MESTVYHVVHRRVSDSDDEDTAASATPTMTPPSRRCHRWRMCIVTGGRAEQRNTRGSIAERVKADSVQTRGALISGRVEQEPPPTLQSYRPYGDAPVSHTLSLLFYSLEKVIINQHKAKSPHKGARGWDGSCPDNLPTRLSCVPPSHGDAAASHTLSSSFFFLKEINNKQTQGHVLTQGR